MTRFFDIAIALTGLIISSPLLLIITLIGGFDTGSPIFRQERVGRHQRSFSLIKFRTMRVDTPSVGTHLADATAITPIGRFLRRSKLDELPQLWNVIKGDMSLVGPRPCLFNQKELITQRAKRNVFDVRPGVTGLAQLKGIDMSTPTLLAQTDHQMLSSLTLAHYFQYILLTAIGRGAGDRANKIT